MANQPRYGMVVDVRRCVGCMSCSVSCKMENSVPFGVFRSNVEIKEKGKYPHVKRHFLPKLCNHCEKAPCVSVCPVGATYKRTDGVVVVNENKCIGCGYCIVTCPYHARFLHPIRKVADKCNFCEHQLAMEGTPACVRNCMGKARVFGDLNDPNSTVSQLLASEATNQPKVELGTEPKVFYIGADNSQVRGER